MCAEEPCKNGGTCNNGVNQYTCDCALGFEGTNCETGDSQNDTCQYHHYCPNTFWFHLIKNNFLTVVDMCYSEPCQNAGTCNNGVNKYTCDCAPGYEGPNCETGDSQNDL